MLRIRHGHHSHYFLSFLTNKIQPSASTWRATSFLSLDNNTIRRVSEGLELSPRTRRSSFPRCQRPTRENIHGGKTRWKPVASLSHVASPSEARVRAKAFLSAIVFRVCSWIPPHSGSYLRRPSVGGSTTPAIPHWLPPSCLSSLFSPRSARTLSFPSDCLHIHPFMLACSLMAVAGVLPGARREKPPGPRLRIGAWRSSPSSPSCMISPQNALLGRQSDGGRHVDTHG